MDISILGSGGCMAIPKPLCNCSICEEARKKGVPFERTGPSTFIHDENILIDTPAEISYQLNRSRIDKIDYLVFSHLDPDHIEGFRVVEQITLDFRTWTAYPDKKIHLTIPETLHDRLKSLHSVYGPISDFYEAQGFIDFNIFNEFIRLGEIDLTAIPVDRGDQISFVYIFEKDRKKVVYAPCDIKPFPIKRKEILDADLLVIQPGIFEEGLKHDFRYPDDHISRTTLYTFEETLSLADQINAKQVLFVHLEEYWNRSHDDYRVIEGMFDNISFAYDGMRMEV
jgi:phosphoribosyl 1,2-cyclic phosphate phosphodiesterase